MRLTFIGIAIGFAVFSLLFAIEGDLLGALLAWAVGLMFDLFKNSGEKP